DREVVLEGERLALGRERAAERLVVDGDRGDEDAVEVEDHRLDRGLRRELWHSEFETSGGVVVARAAARARGRGPAIERRRGCGRARRKRGRPGMPTERGPGSRLSPPVPDCQCRSLLL